MSVILWPPPYVFFGPDQANASRPRNKASWLKGNTSTDHLHNGNEESSPYVLTSAALSHRNHQHYASRSRHLQTASSAQTTRKITPLFPDDGANRKLSGRGVIGTQVAHFHNNTHLIHYSNREYRIEAMPLEPQDIMVVLKLCSYPRKRPPIAMVAADLTMSPSEIHAAIKRLQQSRLLHGPELQEKPNLSALEGFLLHGVKYAFPAENGQVTRGVPTSFAASPLKDEIASSDDLPPVWPWRDGQTRGVVLEPLYRTAPAAALRDPILYELLDLLDVIRDGSHVSVRSPRKSA